MATNPASATAMIAPAVQGKWDFFKSEATTYY
jgi:hypothetical protein